MSQASIQFNFSQQRVLVTGGTSGMGEATAKAFVSAGADVIISGRSQSKADAIIDSLKSESGSIDFIGGDISHSTECDRIVKQAVEKLGGLDIVVNSAEEVAHMVLYASSDSAKFITGYPLVLDGGNRA